ncbi:MAG: hypothetical protein R3348_04565 [Xanthomonadales bacterium]|nr:hypothetical protein [Xanthomonadales bacterium]
MKRAHPRGKWRAALSLLLMFAVHAWAQQVPASTLFGSDQPLELTMSVDFERLCRPSVDPECGFMPTTLRVTDADGERRSIKVHIQRRDGWRALQTNCQVPTLFMRFAEADVAGTPFEGQDTLALTSHCGKGHIPENVPSRRLPDDFESYVVNEYLGYRILNLVTPYSLGARLARMTYRHPVQPRRSFSHYAFFTEHVDDLADRMEAQRVSPEELNPGSVDIMAANRIALFHFMIGNTDWSIERGENVFLLRRDDGQLVPIAYDLDMSGLVNPYYARPAQGAPIRTVRQRHFMGYCMEPGEWEALYREFLDRREAISELLASIPGLGRGDRRVTGVYLDSFYDLLDSREATARSVEASCRPRG